MRLLYANDERGRDAPSWYAATAPSRPPATPLDGEARADVCIVGGGYTGLSAALHLAKRGYDVALIEAHRVGWGASGRNGGQVGSGMRIEPEELDRIVGRDATNRLWSLAEEAKATVRALIADHAIDCDYRDGIVHAAHRARYAKDMKHEAGMLAERFGYDIAFVDKEPFREIVGSPAYHCGTLDPGAGHLHPLKYALGLAEAARSLGVRIHEMTEATRIADGVVETTSGAVKADHVILACNGYLGDIAPRVAARVMPINNFIIATEPLADDVARGLISNGMAVADSKFVVNYFRLSPDNRMLFGGRESYGYRFPRDIKGFVRKAMTGIYPQLADARIDYGWGGTLAITMNRMPHFARLGGGVLSCSGYSGHGVALATLAGKLVSEAVAGQAERFDLMANVPSPRFPGGALMRWPLLVLAMLWFSTRDRL